LGEENPVKLKLRVMRRKMIGYLRKYDFLKSFLDCWRVFGLLSALSGRPRVVSKFEGSSLVVAYPRLGIEDPVVLRDAGSDLEVFRQVFCEQELSCVASLTNVKTIVDAGANIGLSVVYLASRFPESIIIAVEPDPANYAMLLRNTESLGSRVHCVNAAVWSECGKLSLNPVAYRDGSFWSKQFIPVVDSSESQSMAAVTIDELMSRHGLTGIDLLKIDIEGAEGEVFRCGGAWLANTRAIVIELHDDTVFGPATVHFQEKTAGQFRLSHLGERVFAVRTG
jgi:FkbM family methyltransferase